MSRLPHISSQPEGSPEQTLLRFLRAWEKRAWNDMAWACQTSWRLDRRRVEGLVTKQLREWYGHSRPDAVSIIRTIETRSANPEKPGVAVVTIIAQLEVSYQHETGRWLTPPARTFSFRLICEDAEGNPDPEGTWGVHPSSMRPIDDKEGGAPPPSPQQPETDHV